jgi:ribosomal protein S12 methylthiotransferase
VNTCSFIDSAQEESVDAILESNEVREATHRGQALIVSGCLPQRFRDELPKLLPEVDAFMGIDQVAQVGDVVRRALEHRGQKLREKKARVQHPKSNVVRGIAELQKQKPHTHEHERAASVLLANPSLQRPRDAGGTLSLVDVNVRPSFIPDFDTPRFRLTPKHFAYVKIAEGCNHPCTFCIIPRMRGAHRSRQQGDIVREVTQLVADGVKEINLISQDSTYYGLDLRANHSRAISSPEKFNAAANSLPADATTLCTLLRELDAIEGEFWIRLLYTHPAHWTDELIRTIADCPKVARYVDIPLQHIHENMLERMRRETSQQYIVDLIHRLRAGVPGIALRTTFIVGFPGETETYFEALLDFIREAKFERLGVFTYSQEEGTRAAKMEQQIPPRVRQKRRGRAMAEQHKIARAVAESFVGRSLKVLVEAEASARELQKANISSWEHGLIRETDSAVVRLKGRYLIARGEADAPDIDGRVYIRGQLPVGRFSNVRVVGHTDYDLIAEPA